MEKRKNKISSRAILLSICLLVIILIVLLIFQAGWMQEYLVKSNQEVIEFQTQDRCSLIVGQLIHAINNEDECRMKCKNECEVQDRELIKSEFTASTTDCNSCKCTC